MIAGDTAVFESTIYQEEKANGKLVTPAILSNAIFYASQLNGTPIARDVTETIASQVMAFFGFYYEVIDNYLENEDRQNMYLLEDLGLVKLESEEAYLPDGQIWRITKFLLKKDRVLDYCDKYYESIDDPKSVYESLSEDQWKRS
ncbi:MAG: DUF6015 family protein [Thermoplasmatales archaeon]